MSSYIPPEQKLAFDEILIICPHCKKELIKQLEFRATGDAPKVVTRDVCPECYKTI